MDQQEEENEGIAKREEERRKTTKEVGESVTEGQMGTRETR